MLKPLLTHQSSQYSTQTPFLQLKPFIHGNGNASLPNISRYSFQKKNKSVRVGFTPCNIKAVASSTEKATSIEAIVTVKQTTGRVPSEDLVGQTLQLELVSTELDPKTGLEKETIKGYAHMTSQAGQDKVKYESSFEVPAEFGEVGAILVENEHHKEMLLKDIVLIGFPNGPVNFNCNSWVHRKKDNPDQKRIFFANKSYLPSQTPNGLRRLREEELKILRGNGQGKREPFERVYDYDVYNDLGNPDDSSADLKRPVLGGKQHPYPRRCRTGRPHTEKDPLSEKRSSSGSVYVPRDECFSDEKQRNFSAKAGLLGLRAYAIIDTDSEFPHFTAIDSLFDGEIYSPPLKNQNMRSFFGYLSKAFTSAKEYVIRFKTPETMNRDKFIWIGDAEFGRQTLAGLNPYSIQLITEWPLTSKLNPEIYGPPESVITTELIQKEIGGVMTVNEALSQKKLFILDYHDLLLPYVNKVREIKGTTLYGSRTVFFLTPEGTLRPLAIELTRPPMDGKPQWKEVRVPCWDATGAWLWRLAKAHVLAHDSGYHQLVSHWLRTHCATEPYIIATNRQLSVVHPIYRLLHPHFRYTMEINALAREALINAKGIIETSFSPSKYSMELSSAAYDLQWEFNLQALPADLINRGMAVEDLTAPHGLKLTIEDYPFANDGLLLWDNIKEWVSDYVNHYYLNPSLIESDQELQAWWTEIRTVGHADKKDEPWWPVLKTPKDLIEIITTIVWVTSGHHAAVNFGQYTYAGYFPNRPTIARTNMPTEDPTEKEWKKFMEKPELALLKCFPSQLQATRTMAVLDLLSNHSPDEEYLGEKIITEPSWAEDPAIKMAFERFNGRLKELGQIIDKRNGNNDFKNRVGAGIVPYELLKPFSLYGVTRKGVPYSISI